MFKKVLIANRGEIAVRVIRACRELGIKTVAVYSEADKQSLHVKLADESICIGPPSAKESYLNIPIIISAAEVSGAEAIHPGYGFLAENAEFSSICKANKITFIGASPENIKLMGNKSQAKKTVKKFDVPTIPGSDGNIKSEKELLQIAKKTGFPLLIKASAGGGGRGMREVHKQSDLIKNFQMAVNEAESAFGNGDMYVEKLIEEPRHIEIQILSDQKGNAVYLWERECSIQRRHQKLIEEAPSSFVDPKLRKEMGEASIRIAKGIKYQGAGTIEYLVDKHKNFYFMEMNTRIQVEHTITESITYIDLVKQQIKIAYYKTLEIKQKDIPLIGHAIEYRINAEDHTKNFMPCPGKINLFLPSDGLGIRTDSYVYPDYQIPTNYDSLLGKLIVWGRDRDEAILRSERALEEFIIDGVTTTIPFHQEIIQTEAFKSGNINTHFIDQYLNKNE